MSRRFSLEAYSVAQILRCNSAAEGRLDLTVVNPKTPPLVDEDVEELLQARAAHLAR